MTSSMPSASFSPERITGLWINPEGTAYLARRIEAGAVSNQQAPFQPFVWFDAPVPTPLQPMCEDRKLVGAGTLNRLLHFRGLPAYRHFLTDFAKTGEMEQISTLEQQFLTQQQGRQFLGLTFAELRRCQFDIETACSVIGGFSRATRSEDRVLAIGLRIAGKDTLLQLEDDSDEAERVLLQQFADFIAIEDPDTLEGHNSFSFDLDYLRLRCKHLQLPCAWGRWGQSAVFRSSRIRIAERWIDYPRCDIPGRTIVDTYFLLQLFDLTKRDMTAYSLKEAAKYFGITDPADRTYLAPVEIQDAFDHDRASFLAYLSDDLRETAGLAAVLLPTYFAQTQNFPMTFQEVLLRGSAQKVDALLLEKYYHARHSLPEHPEIQPFAGGFTKSYAEGVFEHVLHFDVASLYPSLLLKINRNPETDALGVFVPLLHSFRDYRLQYKQWAQETSDPSLQQEYEARQASFKVLINAFYGYLGYSSARFADGALAAEVTTQGRTILQALIAAFSKQGCTVLEADTDGIYLATPDFYAQPATLLAAIAHVVPEGIDLEFNGHYRRMLCYKAKNYALYDGRRVTVRGSALRSRATEPYLRELTHTLIYYLLGASEASPQDLLAQLRAQLATQTLPVIRLAKREYLSQSPQAYRRAIEARKKPRRASLEVALTLSPAPKTGERITYFIGPATKNNTPDWQRAHAIDSYDRQHNPYDSAYYLKKLDDWEKRYSSLLPGAAPPQQMEFL